MNTHIEPLNGRKWTTVRQYAYRDAREQGRIVSARLVDNGVEITDHGPADPDKPRTRGRPGVYPWDLWLDGEPHRLVLGRDYNRATYYFIDYVREQAKARGMRVSCHRFAEDEEQGITIQAK